MLHHSWRYPSLARVWDLHARSVAGHNVGVKCWQGLTYLEAMLERRYANWMVAWYIYSLFFNYSCNNSLKTFFVSVLLFLLVFLTEHVLCAWTASRPQYYETVSIWGQQRSRSGHMVSVVIVATAFYFSSPHPTLAFGLSLQPFFHHFCLSGRSTSRVCLFDSEEIAVISVHMSHVCMSAFSS